MCSHVIVKAKATDFATTTKQCTRTYLEKMSRNTVDKLSRSLLRCNCSCDRSAQRRITKFVARQREIRFFRHLF